MNRARRLVGALVSGAAVCTLVACGSSEGTVVAKTEQASYDHACQAGGTVTGPVAVPVWGPAPTPGAGGWSCATARVTSPSPA